jgi:hypothetical protein
MMRNRCRQTGPTGIPSRLAFLTIAVALPLVLSGCRTGATGVSPARAFIVPEWSSLEIKSLAFMGVGGSTGEATDRQTAETIVEDQLCSGQDRFVILGLAEGRSRAASAGCADLFDRIVKVWRDDRTCDVLVIQDCCKKVGVDGLIFGDLSEWKRERVDWTSEGNSSTQVDLRLSIYSGKTGLLAWDAQKSARKESVSYRPLAGGSPVYTDRSGASRVERPTSVTPDPPRAEDVAAEAMRSLMAAFPPVPVK